MTIELALLSRVAYRGEDITGTRLPALLALLAGDLRAGCSTGLLVGELWPGAQPEHPTKALQVLVSRARAMLGPGLVDSTPTGYRLTLDERQVDASEVLRRAAASARCARDGDHAATLDHAEAGLALWAAPPQPVADASDDPLASLRAQRAGTHRTLVRARALALARLGRCAEALGPLVDLLRERPRDEELLLELLGCEAAIVGPSAALARYEDHRRALRDELGSDPGATLQAAHQHLLQRAAPTVRHGVAHEPNPLLGRDHDIAAVIALLRVSRVVSIVGPGGLGKTRLAHAVSRAVEHRVVHFVPLAGLTSDGDVVGEVAAAVGAGDARHALGGRVGPTDPVAGIAAALGSTGGLLVLDNCEHLLRGVGDLVRALVAITPDLQVLTTSRAPLGLSSESVHPLSTLRLPVTTELFRQRAAAVRPDVGLPTDAVTELCRHLDGLPLAVELAAARVRTMSVGDVARGLDDRFALLRGGVRDAPERHRTLQAVVDWSWNLLDPAGQAAMRTLSVLPGGFMADAAAHLLGHDATGVLEDLVGQSLLKVDDTPAGVRFSMLETVRAFAAERRDAAGEADLVVDRFLAWARDFGVALHGAPFGADPLTALARIRAELDNLALALRLALDRGDGDAVAATAAVLAALWMIESDFRRLAAVVDEIAWLLSHHRPSPAVVEATRAALALCTAYTFIVDGPRPTRTLVALRRLPAAPPASFAGAAAVVLGLKADDHAGLLVLCDSPDPLVAAIANNAASYVAEAARDLDDALRHAQRMLAGLQDALPWAWALTHARISELCMQLDRAAEARDHLLTALPTAERLDLTADVAGIRHWLVLVNLQLGDVDEAERWLDQTAMVTEGDLVTRTYGLGVRAEILLARGEVEAALALWRDTVHRLRETPPRTGAPDPADYGLWSHEAEAVTVVAHARHDRLDLIVELVRELPDTVERLLTHPRGTLFLPDLSVTGALLLALASVDLVRAGRSGDDRAGVTGTADERCRIAVRMIALAERCHFARSFQPTMSPDHAGRAAAHADRPAYDGAVASYAGLDPDRLREAALAVLRERDALVQQLDAS